METIIGNKNLLKASEEKLIEFFNIVFLTTQLNF